MAVPDLNKMSWENVGGVGAEIISGIRTGPVREEYNCRL